MLLPSSCQVHQQEGAVMLKIWGRKNSSNVRKALWCAEELGLDYEAIDAGGAFGVVDTPQYRALNPNGRVPMIEDGDFVLWESNTIVRYLCAKQASTWYPSDLKARANAEKWMDWTTSTFAEPFKTVFWGVLRNPGREAELGQHPCRAPSLHRGAQDCRPCPCRATLPVGQ
ncbi:glutathione S-transferase [Pseudomonas synxantha]|nr:glutathione S-transferase [Pseudomonas synxantha]